MYACAEGSGTLTAELRPSGSTTSLATVSQRLLVEAVPELAPGSRAPGPRPRPSPAGSTVAVGGAGGDARVGAEHHLPFQSTTTSVRVSVGHAQRRGTKRLTGFGLLLWRTSRITQPAYSSALVKGAGDRGHTSSRGCRPDTTLQVPDPRLQRRRQLRLVDRAAQGGADS